VDTEHKHLFIYSLRWHHKVFCAPKLRQFNVHALFTNNEVCRKQILGTK